jgi:ketosteroid isomerase-like protein
MGEAEMIETARRALIGMGGRPLDPDLFAQDFSFVSDLAGTLDKAAFVSGVARTAAIMRAPLEMRVVATTLQGSRLAVEAASEGDLVDGSRYRNNYHFLFRFDRSGAIEYLREYGDTKIVAEMMWPLFARAGGFGASTAASPQVDE